jgi:hypothetical protein
VNPNKKRSTVSGIYIYASWHLVNFMCERWKIWSIKYKRSQEMAGSFKVLVLHWMGYKALVEITSVSWKSPTYVLRGEPKPYFQITSHHKITPTICIMCERVNIWWWGLHSTTEKKSSVCSWSICASLVWTRSSTIHHHLIWRGQLGDPVMAFLTNGWDHFRTIAMFLARH